MNELCTLMVSSKISDFWKYFRAPCGFTGYFQSMKQNVTISFERKPTLTEKAQKYLLVFYFDNNHKKFMVCYSIISSIFIQSLIIF